VALMGVLVLVACGNDPAPATATTPTVTESTEYFTGALDPRGAGFFSFTVAQAGTVRVTLTNLSTSRFVPLSASVELGIGVPAGEGCAVTDAVTAEPSLNAQLVVTRPAGIHCVEIRDRASLTSQMAFVVRIFHP